MNYMKTALKMQEKFSKMHKVREFRVGEYVSVRIPRIDRSCTDLLRLPCIVVEVVGKAQSLHRLRCKSGVIQRCYQAGDLEPYRGQYDIPLDGWENEPRISLKEAAKNQAPWNAFTDNKCNCKAEKCDNFRCSCRKNKIYCSNHCHKGNPCKNRGPPEISEVEKGEVALHRAWGLCWEYSI